MSIVFLIKELWNLCVISTISKSEKIYKLKLISSLLDIERFLSQHKL